MRSRCGGVSSGTASAACDQPAGTKIYLPYAQKQGSGAGNMYVILRSKGDPLNMVGSVRRELNELDPTLPLANIRLMDDMLSEAQAQPRFLTVLLSLFSSVALAIATMGI